MSAQLLAGCGVLVTRPARQASELADSITACGGRPVRFPVFEIEPGNRDDIEAENALLPDPDLIIFVSANAARYGYFVAREERTDIAAIGPATQRILHQFEIGHVIIPDSKFDSEHLLRHPRLKRVAGSHITIVRGTDGREQLATELRRRGAAVSYLATYARRRLQPTAKELAGLEKAWQDGDIDVVSVMSVATLQNLLELLPATLQDRLRKTPLVAPGDRVLKTARELLPGLHTIKANGPQPDDIIQALIGWKDLA